MKFKAKLRILEKANELIKIRVWAVAQVDDCPVNSPYVLVRKVS